MSVEAAPVPIAPAYTVFQKSLNSTAVVAALIATLAFISMLMPPRPLGPDPGDSMLASSQLALFAYTNTLAFCFSMLVVLLCVLSIPDPEDPELVLWKRRWRVVGFLVWLSSVCFGIAFMSGAYVTFATIEEGELHDHWIAFTTICSFVFGSYIALLIFWPGLLTRLGVA